ncbi:MAG: CvpA family protein [Prevotellaceae bacterium]|jgi:membrane protein required for colicin V production|nr:CvpA family protein [Prevotellaceae bacterium]
MNYIDIIIIALLVVAAIFGVWKGFVRQLFGLVALLLGIYCALHFSGYAATFISQWIDKNETAVTIISFAITFVVVLLGVVFVGKLADRIIKIVALGLFNRLFGILFSVAKMAFILSICIWLLLAFDHLWPFFPHQDSHQSLLFAPVSKLAPSIFPYLKALFTSIGDF